MFCCLMKTGVNLSDAACEALYQQALRMTSKGIEHSKVINDDVCGTIDTDYETVNLGSFVGYEFKAMVENPKGKKATISFIVQSADLDYEEDHIWLRFNRKKKNDL